MTHESKSSTDLGYSSSGNSLLLRFFQSTHFTTQLCVAYLAKYRSDIGIQHYLCQKLSKFPYQEVEYFLPELVHICLTHVNESVALEEFILELCAHSTQFALMSFWLFQAYLRQHSSSPFNPSFAVCRRMFNQIQKIIFEPGSNPAGQGSEKLLENFVPAIVLSSLIWSSVAIPSLTQLIGPIAIAQGKRPPGLPDIDSLTENSSPRSPPRYSFDQDPQRTPKLGEFTTAISNVSSTETLRSLPKPIDKETAPENFVKDKVGSRRRNLRSNDWKSYSEENGQTDRNASRSLAFLPYNDQVALLKTNYFRLEMQFLLALQDIATKLVMVPAPARLSALRAELILINNDLPAEVNIPGMSSIVDPGHMILRIDPSEAVILNSAERVPFLIMVEVLKGHLSFNPRVRHNRMKLNQILSGHDRGRKFDLSQLAKRRYSDTNMPYPYFISHSSKEAYQSVDTDEGDIGKSHWNDDASGNETSSLSDDSFVLDEEDETSLERNLKTVNEEERNATYESNTIRSKAAVQISVMPTTVGLESLPNGNQHEKLSSPSETALSDSVLISGQLSVPVAAKVASGTSGPNPAGSNEISDAGTYRLARHSTDHYRRKWRGASHLATGASQKLSALATHMRAAATMLAQLDASGAKRPRAEVASIKARIVAEMQSLEELRLKQTYGHLSSTVDALPLPDDSHLDRRGDKEDPSAAILREHWEEKKERIRRASPCGHLRDWELISVIVKTGADLRQEAFACQLIRAFKKIWESTGVDVWVRHINILVTGDNSGLVETITNAVSVHSIKKNLTREMLSKNPKLTQMATLMDYFNKTYGERDSAEFRDAQTAFIKSLAAYSIIQYLLQLKDRHNGNILVDQEGHLVHIDFGFMLANSPGNVGFESAPFKLTSEYLDIIGDRFDEFTSLMKQAFKAARKHAEDVLVLVQVMEEESSLPCFQLGNQTHPSLRQRFQLSLSESEVDAFCDVLVHKSNCSVWTRLYDQYQTLSQGIY